MSVVKLPEAMGILPLRERYAQALVALRGEEDVPASRVGLSSLRLLNPRMGIPLWRGRAYVPGKVILTNLFNHRQTPIDLGWSVKKSQVEDFRGGDLTYDSHNGTDLAIPVGTTVVAPAAGCVVRVVSEFNRGGLKVFLDHGDGLMTCCAHLARPLVEEGDVVGRGEPIAISGYSGLDGFATFPFGVPHVHFNTWLNGVPVDPFARAGEVSLWREGAPVPTQAEEDAETYTPSVYDEAGVDALVESCVTAHVRDALRQIEPLERRAAYAVIGRNYYPTRFAQDIAPYREIHPRSARLDLPFLSGDFDGVVFADAL